MLLFISKILLVLKKFTIWIPKLSVFIFPNDYKEFLLQHNGMEMFDGIEILSLEGIIEYNEVQDFPEGYIFNWISF